MGPFHSFSNFQISFIWKKLHTVLFTNLALNKKKKHSQIQRAFLNENSIMTKSSFIISTVVSYVLDGIE